MNDARRHGACGEVVVFNVAVAGHLFVLRGDLKQLKCAAVLVPCDNSWNVVWDNWGTLLPEEQFEFLSWGDARLRDGGHGRYVDLPPSDGRAVRLVVTADGRDDPDWLAAGVKEAIETFALDRVALDGRVKPLVALPLVGTGEGGFRWKRGLLIRILLPAVQAAARNADLDVALVLRDDRDHFAVQALRSDGDWSEFSAEDLEIADDLGARAARQELSLFLGAGVSIPLGLPDWKDLLTEIGGEALPEYSAEMAPQIAQKISDRIGRTQMYHCVASRLNIAGLAPAHLLLAALNVRQTVTTNFDTAYETALEGALGPDTYRVLVRQLAAQPHPWILKLHGDVQRPETIVLAERDYARLKDAYGALHGLVESLLMTSHLMFVGYSMADQDFVEAAQRVRVVRELADGDAAPDLATVLALHPEAVTPPPGFSTVAMTNAPDDKAAARRLEIFLDRISWAASRQGTGSLGYLLDPNYQDLFADDRATLRLRTLLDALLQLPEDDPARESRGWGRVDEMLTVLGGHPRPSH